MDFTGARAKTGLELYWRSWKEWMECRAMDFTGAQMLAAMCLMRLLDSTGAGKNGGRWILLALRPEAIAAAAGGGPGFSWRLQLSSGLCWRQDYPLDSCGAERWILLAPDLDSTGENPVTHWILVA